MNIERKITLLKNKIINNKLNYDVNIIRLLNVEALVTIINDLDEQSLLQNIEVDNKIIADRFISLLDRLNEIFKIYFPSIKNKEAILKIILNSNQDLVKEYFLMNCYSNNNKYMNMLNEKIYKIIISNFICNSKYIPNIKAILAEHNLSLKNINNYSLEETTKIMELLSDIVFSKNSNNKGIILFENINTNIKHNMKKLDYPKLNKYKESFIEYYIHKYDLVFKDYHTKKKYIKYFK